ncbi:MAG: hypothetical protein U0X20_32090 [Caldilineaceae bacterium]
MSMTLVQAAEQLQRFEQGSLRGRIAALEQSLHGADGAACAALAPNAGVGPELWAAAQYLKAVAGQINVVVHASGILLALPYLLEEGEVVEALSLGAGNTGVPFDLITDRRVAEFKFTHWRGGAESVRKRELFKDFYLLAEADTPKQRYMYVMDDHIPLKFLRSRSSIASLLSRNNSLWTAFQARYGTRFATVSEYYAYRQATVTIVGLAQVVPHFAQELGDEEEPGGDGGEL